jgi:hypothetical protein
VRDDSGFWAFAVFMVIAGGALISFASGYGSGRHTGKWTERCRHMRCDNGKAEWLQANDTDACVCVTRAK